MSLEKSTINKFSHQEQASTTSDAFGAEAYYDGIISSVWEDNGSGDLPSRSLQQQNDYQLQGIPQQYNPNLPFPQQPNPNYYGQQQQQQQIPQINPNVPSLPYYPNQGHPQNAEQNFMNDFIGKFQGFAGGEINGATDVNVSDAMVSFGFNVIIFVIFFSAYETVSRLVPSVYQCRKFHVSDDRVIVDIPKSYLPFSWLPSVLRANWDTVRKCGGLDAYFFLRFIRMCFIITSVSGLWGIIILWPIFGSGGGGASGWYHFSMANVRGGSSLIWAPTIFMWFLVSS